MAWQLQNFAFRFLDMLGGGTHVPRVATFPYLRW